MILIYNNKITIDCILHQKEQRKGLQPRKQLTLKVKKIPISQRKFQY